MKLYIKADGQYAGTQKDAGKGHTPVDVPVDKAGLIDYLNAMGAAPVAALSDEDRFANNYVADREAEEKARHRSQAEIDALFEPTYRALPCDKVCAAVSSYSGTDLGMVALEVAARYKALAS